MQKIQIGVVTDNEKDKIQKIQNHKNTLIELKHAIYDTNFTDFNNHAIKIQVEYDLQLVENEINEWWNTIVSKYNLDIIGSSRWHLNYTTNQITLFYHSESGCTCDHHA